MLRPGMRQGQRGSEIGEHKRRDEVGDRYTGG